jgi:hypothetical protein
MMTFLRRWKYTITASCLFVIGEALLIARHRWLAAASIACVIIFWAVKLYRERDR